MYGIIFVRIMYITIRCMINNYPSIGCEHCTRQVMPGEDPRAGRWAGQEKTECGLHK